MISVADHDGSTAYSDYGSDGTMRNFTWQEVRVMLTNLQWMVLNGHAFHPDSDTVANENGGVDMETLADEGCTPATRYDGWNRDDDTGASTAQSPGDTGIVFTGVDAEGRSIQRRLYEDQPTLMDNDGTKG